MSKFKKVCLLKGGTSTEREVSLSSADGFATALKDLGYEVVEFDFTGDVLALVTFLKNEKPDCVLNGLYGGTGENGDIQALLNLMQIPYTHSGVVASAIAMDKHLARTIFKKAGLKVADGKVVNWKEFREHPSMAYPFVVKAIDGGSSAGVFVVQNEKELNAIDWCYKDNVLVEAYIPGRELTVGIINNKPVEVTEILVKSGFYDYHNKYCNGCSFHELPAKIPSDIREKAMDMALKAHLAVGCRGISRVDFRYNDKTGELFILELNSQPGMTVTSLLPEQAKAIGMTFNQLVQYMVEEACYDI